MTFNELVRLVERNGFRLMREKGSVRYYTNPRTGKDVRIDYHGSKEAPRGTCYPGTSWANGGEDRRSS